MLCKEKYLLLAESVSQAVEQEKVVQLVWSDEVFGLLRNPAFAVCRCEFRADRSVGNVQKHVPYFISEPVARGPDDKRADQSLRDAAVDGIH